MKVKIIKNIENLKLNEDNWRKIYKSNQEGSFFVSFDYVFNWYHCFLGNGKIRIYCCYKDENIIGYFPLFLVRENGIRILKSLTNEHCFHSGYLVDKKYEKEFIIAVLQELDREKKDWDVIKYSYIYSFKKNYGFFLEPVLKQFYKRVVVVQDKTYTVSLGEDFQQYLNEDISSNTKKNYKRCFNKLCKTGTWELQHYKGNSAIVHWNEFINIEDSGWKGDYGTSIRSLDSNYKCYYQKFLDILAENKSLDIYFLEYNNKKIAGVFGYTEKNIFHWAKTAYDERYKNLSPSNILIMQIIRDLIENNPEIEMFHMFPWDYGYKHRYANINTYVSNFIVFSKSYRGLCIQIGYKIKKKLINAKRRLKI